MIQIPVPPELLLQLLLDQEYNNYSKKPTVVIYRWYQTLANSRKSLLTFKMNIFTLMMEHENAHG